MSSVHPVCLPGGRCQGWAECPTHHSYSLMWYPLHDCPWRWDLGRQGEDRGALIMWLASLQEEAQSAVLLSVPSM